MEIIKIAASTWDVGLEVASYDDFVQKVIEHVKYLWEKGADIVLLPEYLWLGLERFLPKEEALEKVALKFWTETWLQIQQALAGFSQMAVLGSCPYLDEGRLYNRAPILIDGRAVHQDKLNMTPWESLFQAGGEVKMLTYKGLKIAVVICLDIEITELACVLKKEKFDLVLVPSATENLLGVERINRCASSRAVELGCYVAVAHLVGKCESVLVDENRGCTAFYLPSQAAFQSQDREQRSEVFDQGIHASFFDLEPRSLTKMRKMRMETNPALVFPSDKFFSITKP